jgi:hypothetical protein
LQDSSPHFTANLVIVALVVALAPPHVNAVSSCSGRFSKTLRLEICETHGNANENA